MSIYIRGDATPFVLIGKAFDATGRLVGYWSDDPQRVLHVTDESRIVADGAAAEVVATVEVLDLIRPCGDHGGSITCSCNELFKEATERAYAAGEATAKLHAAKGGGAK